MAFMCELAAPLVVTPKQPPREVDQGTGHPNLVPRRLLVYGEATRTLQGL